MEDETLVYYYYVLALVIIVLDQITKWYIVKSMELGERITIIENVLYITSHRNKGAAFGILQGQMWFFYIVTIIVIVFLIYYIQKEAKKSRFLGISLGLLLGGAIGNFIDRVFRGEVVDFIDTYIITYDFPIFNVADSALVIGVGLMMIKFIDEERKAKRSK
ncbi:signal peptidase II [Bacillus alkalicellulosilyticus]|uniref:signal peptidase II n=1 Tax=Alkalihalobacterium alkalicellulosilyticum TaxID=1912214 RepID=UPI000998C911